LWWSIIVLLVVDLVHTHRFVVSLQLVVQRDVQQIHNKSK